MFSAKKFVLTTVPGPSFTVLKLSVNFQILHIYGEYQISTNFLLHIKIKKAASIYVLLLNSKTFLKINFPLILSLLL